MASSGRRWAEPRRAGPPVVGRTHVCPPAALVATPTPWWSLPQPVRAMMALGCSVLRCFVVWASPMRLSPNNLLRPTNGLGHARRRLHRPDCLAHVEGPAPDRGLGALGAADRLCRSVSTRRRRQVQVARTSASSLSTTSFFRSMICTPVVQAKPRPGYTFSTNPLSVFGPFPLCL